MDNQQIWYLTLHALARWRLRLALENLMIALRGHTSSYATKHNVCDAVNDSRQGVVSFTRSEAGDNRAKTGKDLQTIGATNQANVVLVQTQAVLLTNHHARRRSRQAGTTKGLEAHARAGTHLVPALTRLETATSVEASWSEKHPIMTITARDTIQTYPPK